MSVRDVVGKDDSGSAFEVWGSDGFKSFLSSSVPNLEFDNILTALNGSDFKIDTNGGEVTLAEDVVGESEEETGFGDRRITDKDNFEKVVEVFVHEQ